MSGGGLSGKQSDPALSANGQETHAASAETMLPLAYLLMTVLRSAGKKTRTQKIIVDLSDHPIHVACFREMAFSREPERT